MSKYKKIVEINNKYKLVSNLFDNNEIDYDTYYKQIEELKAELDRIRNEAK